MDEGVRYQELRKLRALPRRQQAMILARVAVAAVAVVAAVLIVKSFIGGHEEPVAASEPGTFLPTKEQTAGDPE